MSTLTTLIQKILCTLAVNEIHLNVSICVFFKNTVFIKMMKAAGIIDSTQNSPVSLLQHKCETKCCAPCLLIKRTNKLCTKAGRQHQQEWVLHRPTIMVGTAQMHTQESPGLSDPCFISQLPASPVSEALNPQRLNWQETAS